MCICYNIQFKFCIVRLSHRLDFLLTLLLCVCVRTLFDFIVVNIVIFTNEYTDWDGDIKINNTKNLYPEIQSPPLLNENAHIHVWFKPFIFLSVLVLFLVMFNQPLCDYLWSTTTIHWIRICMRIFSFEFFEDSILFFLSVFQLAAIINFSSVLFLLFLCIEIFR